MKACFGLLVIFFCPGDKATTVSDFCEQTRGVVPYLYKLSPQELAALTSPRKRALLSLRRKFEKLC